MNRDERFLYTTAGVETPPETPEAAEARRHREWEASLRINQNAPPITTTDYLRPKGRWKDVRILAAELIEAERAAEEDRRREMECPTLREIPAPEF